MKRAKMMLAMFVVASFGLWGCAQGPNSAPGSAERIRTLETKLAKIEEDYRAAATVRDQLRKKLNAAEEQREKQNVELQSTVQDRDQARQSADELRQQLQQRIAERDALQAQYEQFRKGIRSLLGQADSSPNTQTASAS